MSMRLCSSRPVCRWLAEEQVETQYMILLAIGELETRFGNMAAALTAAETRLQLARDHNNKAIEASSLLSIGCLQEKAGKHPQAIEDLERCRSMFRELDDKDGECRATDEIGNVHLLARRIPGSAGPLSRDLAD